MSFCEFATFSLAEVSDLSISQLTTEFPPKAPPFRLVDLLRVGGHEA